MRKNYTKNLRQIAATICSVSCLTRSWGRGPLPYTHYSLKMRLILALVLGLALAGCKSTQRDDKLLENAK